MANRPCLTRSIVTLCTLCLLCLFAPLTHAAGRDDALTGVDAWSSTVFQQGQSSFSGLGLRVRLSTARVPNVEFLPTIEYWRNASNVSEFGIKSVRRDATLGADARYNFAAHGNLHPYVGAGLGLHFLQSQVDAPRFGLTNAQDSVVKAGLAAMLGAEFGSERFGNFVELKYHEVAGYRQVKLNFGLNWHLGVPDKPVAPAAQ